MGQDFTAKDFRTWAGTVLAAQKLCAMESATSATAAKQNVLAAIDQVAESLGNTRAVCRKCYVHPLMWTRTSKDGCTRPCRRSRCPETRRWLGLALRPRSVRWPAC